MKVNVTLSQRWSKLVHARNKECFNNALAVVFAHRPGTRKLRYVEGYAVGRFGIPMEHGWVEWHGEILEVTPTWLKDAGVTKYYPVARFTRAEAGRLARLKGQWLPFTGCGGGTKWRCYRQHWQDGYQQAMREQLGEEAYAVFRTMFNRISPEAGKERAA